MRWSIVLLFVIVMVPMAQATIMDIDITNEKLIMPGGNQTLTLTLTKPALSEPIDITINISINGSATFDGEKKLQFTFNEINWSKGLIKSYKKIIPINVINNETTIQTTSIDASMSYYNTIFGYKKTRLSEEKTKVNFNTIWTFQDEKFYEDYTQLKEEYEKQKDQNNILRKELQSQSVRNSELRTINRGLEDENTLIKHKYNLFKVYQISTFILIILIIYLVIEQFLHKKRKF